MSAGGANDSAVCFTFFRNGNDGRMFKVKRFSDIRQLGMYLDDIQYVMLFPRHSNSYSNSLALPTQTSPLILINSSLLFIQLNPTHSFPVIFIQLPPPLLILVPFFRPLSPSLPLAPIHPANPHPPLDRHPHAIEIYPPPLSPHSFT